MALHRPPKKILKSSAQRMPKLNSLLECKIFLAAVVFCHDRCMPQKDCVRETLALAKTDLLFELFKWESSVEKHRLGKQIGIKTRRQKHPSLNVKDKSMSADCNPLLWMITKIGNNMIANHWSLPGVHISTLCYQNLLDLCAKFKLEFNGAMSSNRRQPDRPWR